MTHLLSLGGRDRADDAEELVLLNDVPDEVGIDMSYYSVPNDAAFLKFFTPNYVSYSRTKPSYMWASREFETHRSSGAFPAYTVSGFGLLDACMHAYATNSTLVLHPLDIILSVCYAYGNQRKKPIFHNNEELKNSTQIVLKQEFTRSNLLLAMVARLARRVETFPLGKLYSLINTELSSPDPLVMRLIIGVLSYLAATRDTMKYTLDQMRNLFDLHEHSTDRLMESTTPTRLMSTGMLDVRHDPNEHSRRKQSSKDANNQQVVSEKSTKGDPETAALIPDVAMPTSVASSGFRVRPVAMAVRRSSVNGAQGQSEYDATADADAEIETDIAEPEGRVTVQATEAAAATATAPAGGNATDDMKILGDWRLMFDSATAEGEGEQEGSGGHADAPYEAAPVAHRPTPLDVLSIISSEGVEGAHREGRRDANNSNVAGEREALDWNPKLRVPTRMYKFRKESGVHSVLFKGNQRAWLELPEALQELCQFFMLDNRLLMDIIGIGIMLQKTRLNINRECRKWWSEMLFREGLVNPMPDGDFLISGWLSVLLGGRMISEYCSMTVNRLCSLKTGVKLPLLLVRQPANSGEESDDSVLDPDIGLQKTRLHFLDEYREKLVNSSSNASEVPVGMFMPWRSCDALNRTQRLWRQVGGDSPVMSRPFGEAFGGAKNRNNMENRVLVLQQTVEASAEGDDRADVQHVLPAQRHRRLLPPAAERRGAGRGGDSTDMRAAPVLC